MKTYKKGISLIVLVITVIVLAILATTVIISLSNTNIITEANEAVIKNRFKSMQEQLKFYVADQISVTKGDFKSAELDAAAKSDKIDEIFPELKDTKYYDYVSLVDGHIVMAEDMPDREVALEVISEYEEPDVITNYTQADIEASNGNIVAIGATNALDVVGVYSADGKVLTITKNSPTSDGEIKNHAFFDEDEYASTMKSSVEIINIEKGITNTGTQSFQGAANLKTINMADSVIYAGDFFASLTPLENIKLSSNLKSIGDSAFSVTNLTSITLPSSLNSISSRAFWACPLTNVIFENPNGWYTTDYSEYEDAVTSESLASPSSAAYYLSDEYYSILYWYRVD